MNFYGCNLLRVNNVIRIWWCCVSEKFVL